jgi:hypothetical protein
MALSCSSTSCVVAGRSSRQAVTNKEAGQAVTNKEAGKYDPLLWPVCGGQSVNGVSEA